MHSRSRKKRKFIFFYSKPLPWSHPPRIGVLEEKLRSREEAGKLLEAQAKEQSTTLRELEAALEEVEHSLTLKEQEVRGEGGGGRVERGGRREGGEGGGKGEEKR